ncbi:hypothetical protein BSKO_13751 [Bryopsis sp. KO-2023]|nr:hypothetical protein BSKO_13751 [Bryopsis sp. KO-2023]
MEGSHSFKEHARALLFFSALWLVGCVASEQGFLQAELPLTIVASTPIEIVANNGSTVELEGSDSITIVFSRAVVPLGSDFGNETDVTKIVAPFTFSSPGMLHGKFRWVTTSVFTWSPDGEWAPDLSFDLVWNQDLQTHDGVPLTLATPARVPMKTTSFSQIQLLGVGSDRARELTDGHWDGELGSEIDNLPELPPDGLMVLKFPYPVELSVIQKAFKVLKVGDAVSQEVDPTSLSIKLRRCATLNETLVDENDEPIARDCAIAQIIGGELENGVRYDVVLPKGTRYNKKAGVLKDDIHFEVFGLRPFKLPFLETFETPSSQKYVGEADESFVNSRNMTIWLPHGLSDGVSMSDLQSAVALQHIPWRNPGNVEQVPFELMRINKGTLSMFAQINPGQKYRLTVSARDDILDGFGLPLEFSEVEFATSNLINFVAIPDGWSYHGGTFYDEGMDWDGKLPILSGGYRPPVRAVKAYVVDFYETLEGTLSVFDEECLPHCSSDNLEEVLEKQKPDLVVHIPDTMEVSVTTMDLKDLLKETGYVAIHRTLPGGEETWNYFREVKNSDLTMTRIRFEEDGSMRIEIMFWIVSFKTGKPVKNVDIEILKQQQFEGQQVASKKLTDADGMAVFLGDACQNIIACEQQEERFSYWKKGDRIKKVSRGIESWIHEKMNEGKIVLDRNVVEPGDVVHLGGFISTFTSNGSLVPYGAPGENSTLQMNLTINSYSPAILSFNVSVEPQFGTFSHKLRIPADMENGDYFIGFSDEAFSWPDAGLTVGEPRIPIAELELTGPDWVKPNSTFEVSVVLSTRLGTNVANAEVTIQFGESGQEIVTTDEFGRGSATIDLKESRSSFSEKPDIGASISLVATWIGPTREKLESTHDIKIQLMSQSVNLLLSKDMIWFLPGQDFGAMAKVEEVGVFPTEHVEGVDVEIEFWEFLTRDDYSNRHENLLLRRKDSSIEKEATLIDSCNVKSGDFSALEKCRFKIPNRSSGRYHVRACIFKTKDEFSCAVDNGIYLQRDDGAVPEIIVKSLELEPGENAEVFIDMPGNDTTVLMSWGNAFSMKRQIFNFEKEGMQKFDLEMGDHCMYGCEIRSNIIIPRRGHQKPSFHRLERVSPVTLSKKGKVLNVTVATEDETIESGKNTTVTVRVRKCEDDLGGTSTSECKKTLPAQNVEVLVMAVDKAYLQLGGHSLENIAPDAETPELTRNGGSEISIYEVTGRMHEVVQNAIQLMEVDPWVTSRMFRSLSSSFLYPEEIESFPTSITHQPPSLDPSFLSFLGREFQQPSSELTGPSARSPDEKFNSPDLRAQSDFKVTPLFKTVKTDENGEAQIDFIAPDNLGTFVIRAYAASDTLQRGSNETEILVRLPLSLSASAPRLVRVGDSFEAGAVVTATGKEPEGLPVTVTLLTDPTASNSIEYIPSDDSGKPSVRGADACSPDGVDCLVTLEKKVFETDSDGQAEVRFRFNATRVGNATVSIRADAPGMSDALELSFPVVEQQVPVQIATSFTVRGKSSRNSWSEGLQLPDALPGTGTIEISAGVGRVPSVLSIINHLLEEEIDSTLNAHRALALATALPVLESYDLGPGNPTFNKSSNAFVEAMNALENELTDEIFGLMYSAASDSSRVNVELNSWGVWVGKQVANRIRKNGQPKKKTMMGGALAVLKNMASTWTKNLQKQLVEDAENARREDFDLGLDYLAAARAAVGLSWKPPLCPSSETAFCTDETVSNSLSGSQLFPNMTDLSVESRALIAIAWMEDAKNGGAEYAKVAVDSLLNDIRVIGRTAFIPTSSQSVSPAGPKGQALALLALVNADEDGPLVEKLANRVASGSSCYPSSCIAKLLALSAYDQATKSTNPDVSVQAKSGKTSLIKAEFDGSEKEVAVVTNSTSFEELASPPDPIMIRAKGKGEVSLVTLLDFVPAEVLLFPSYRGIYIERIVQLSKMAEPVGKELSVIPLGSELAITIQVTSPDDLGEVVVRALMPGGIEPVDPKLSETSSTTCVLNDIGVEFISWRWPLCPEQVTDPSEVKFEYVGGLRAGTNSITFQAIAASVGDWIFPPVHAFSVEQPEVMGLSSGGKITICDGPTCKAKRSGSMSDRNKVPVKGCPNNCSGAGTCDLGKGNCHCDVGFSGKDCGEIVEA